MGPADPAPDAATQTSISDHLERLAGYGIGPGRLTPSGDPDDDLSGDRMVHRGRQRLATDGRPIGKRGRYLDGLMRQMTERRLSGVLGGRFKRSDIRAIDLYASTIRCMG